MLEWSLAQVVCRLKTVVGQDSVESLNGNIITFGTGRHSLVTWLGGDPSPEILQKLTSCLIKWTKRLHCNWLEDTLILQTRIFGDFELTCNKLTCNNVTYINPHFFNCMYFVFPMYISVHCLFFMFYGLSAWNKVWLPYISRNAQ